MPIDTANRFGVGSCADGITLIMPPRPGQLITNDDALNLAAYLVCCAGPLASDHFADVLEAIQST